MTFFLPTNAKQQLNPKYTQLHTVCGRNGGAAKQSSLTILAASGGFESSFELPV